MICRRAFFTADVSQMARVGAIFATNHNHHLDLSRQVARAIDLMRTGITFELEQQNRDLLQDMNRRARLQLRLQGFVQGLSTAALAYYLSGLTVYLAKGMRDAEWLPKNVTADMFVAMALPLTIFASWSFMERVRRLTMKAREEEKVN